MRYDFKRIMFFFHQTNHVFFIYLGLGLRRTFKYVIVIYYVNSIAIDR